jgi:hypothetical protein
MVGAILRLEISFHLSTLIDRDICDFKATHLCEPQNT